MKQKTEINHSVWKDGKKVVMRFYREITEAYDDPETHAFIRGSIKTYLDSINGVKQKENRATIHGDRIEIVYGDHIEHYDRVNKDAKKMESEQKFWETFQGLSEIEQEQDYLRGIGVCEE
jgi:hypothetical protein